MSVIYLRHPIHGTKVATMEAEAVYDEGNGWTRYTLDVTSDEPEAIVATEPRRRRRAEPQDE